MNGFNWTKAIVYGVLIWGLMFGLAWLAVGIGILYSVWTQIILAAIAGLITYAFASNIRARDFGHAFGYGLVFAAIGVVLDLIFSRLAYPSIYGVWTYYLAYALVLLAPMFRTSLNLTTPHAV